MIGGQVSVPPGQVSGAGYRTGVRRQMHRGVTDPLKGSVAPAVRRCRLNERGENQMRTNQAAVPMPASTFVATCDECGQVFFEETSSRTSLLTLVSAARREHAITVHGWQPPVRKERADD